jgi:hypothetical protein
VPVPPPAVEVVEVATWPVEHRYEKVGVAGFWWGPSAFAEVAQSLLVPEALELTELRFGVQRTSGAKDWQTVPEETIAFGHDVTWYGTVPDGRFRVTIWPLDGPGDAVIDMAGIPPITEQTMVADIPIAGYSGAHRAVLRLPEPVQLEAGYYLVSLGVDGFGDPEVFNLYVWGRTHGFTDQSGFERDQGFMPCEYLESTTDYPHGRAYYRLFSIVKRPTLLENATTVFREHRAKVLSESLNDCEYPDVFLPGDIELALIGR